MKLINTLLFVGLIAVASAIPWKAQIALANSLEVGRDEDPNTWECAGCDAGNQPLHTYIIEEKAKDVKSSLAVYEQYTVLAFRYTNTIKNVGQDLLWAFQRQDEEAPSGCKVQRQMDRMWNSIRSDVLKGLRETVHTGRLIISGISLGGALSVLSYVDIARSGIFENVEIITFGAPRVGNRKWANWFDSITTSTRYFIKNDPIAVLPRCFTFLCNYKQTGIPIRCNKNKEVCSVQNCASKELYNDQEEIGNASEYLSDLSQAIIQHNSQEQLDGIIDHIYGYKKIYKYAQVEC